MLVSVEQIKQHLVDLPEDDDYVLGLYSDMAEAELQAFVSKTIVHEVENEDEETAFTPLMLRFVLLHVSLSYAYRVPLTDKPVSKVPGLSLDHLLTLIRDQ